MENVKNTLDSLFWSKGSFQKDKNGFLRLFVLYSPIMAFRISSWGLNSQTNPIQLTQTKECIGWINLPILLEVYF